MRGQTSIVIGPGVHLVVRENEDGNARTTSQRSQHSTPANSPATARSTGTAEPASAAAASNNLASGRSPLSTALNVGGGDGDGDGGGDSDSDLFDDDPADGAAARDGDENDGGIWRPAPPAARPASTEPSRLTATTTALATWQSELEDDMEDE